MSMGLTIGEFSQATHLSVKTLRHYHEVGLLEPSFVNPGNGYRHYVEAQIPVAQVIRRLRDLEMPVADVRAVVAATDSATRNALIAAHLDRLEADLARTREAVSSLRNLITRPSTALEVEHRTVPPTPAIAIHDVVDRADILSWWQGALGELHANVAAHASGSVSFTQFTLSSPNVRGSVRAIPVLACAGHQTRTKSSATDVVDPASTIDVSSSRSTAAR